MGDHAQCRPEVIADLKQKYSPGLWRGSAGLCEFEPLPLGRPAGAGLPVTDRQAMVTTTFRLPSPAGDVNGTSGPIVPKKLSRIETSAGFVPATVAWFPSE